MLFRTKVDIPPFDFRIEPFERMLFIGSCFADSIGRRFAEEKFRATVNPYGVMYNPVSIQHTAERFMAESGDRPRVAMLTLGTNHVYRLNETGEIVDNCRKRPQRLFTEEQLSIDECRQSLQYTVDLLAERNPEVRVVVTVSPIRYAKYGFHGSQLSKATLLLAADLLVKDNPGRCHYFPAYEIVCDELRDYRFYADDMLHPSARAVEYIWQQFSDAYFSPAAKAFIAEWKPIKEALGHKPFNPDSNEYREFMANTLRKKALLEEKYNGLEPNKHNTPE